MGDKENERGELGNASCKIYKIWDLKKCEVPGRKCYGSA